MGWNYNDWGPGIVSLARVVDRVDSACVQCPDCGQWLTPEHGEMETMWACDCGALVLADWEWWGEDN